MTTQPPGPPPRFPYGGSAQNPQWHAPTPPPQSRAGRSVGFGVLVGVALAVLVAVVLYFADALPTRASGDERGAISKVAVRLPATVSGYVRYQDATINKRAVATAPVANARKVDQRTGTALSTAYGGAGATVQTYTDQTLMATFAIRAVRAWSPAPVVTYQDATYLGMARPLNEVQRFGQVSCVVANQPTAKGRTPPADSVITTLCQRSGTTLTVTYVNGGISSLENHPQQCAALVDKIWAQLT